MNREANAMAGTKSNEISGNWGFCEVLASFTRQEAETAFAPEPAEKLNKYSFGKGRVTLNSTLFAETQLGPVTGAAGFTARETVLHVNCVPS